AMDQGSGQPDHGAGDADRAAALRGGRDHAETALVPAAAAVGVVRPVLSRARENLPHGWLPDVHGRRSPEERSRVDVSDGGAVLFLEAPSEAEWNRVGRKGRRL